MRVDGLKESVSALLKANVLELNTTFLRFRDDGRLEG